jgi:hypothetical protein
MLGFRVLELVPLEHSGWESWRWAKSENCPSALPPWAHRVWAALTEGHLEEESQKEAVSAMKEAESGAW